MERDTTTQTTDESTVCDSSNESHVSSDSDVESDTTTENFNEGNDDRFVCDILADAHDGAGSALGAVRSLMRAMEDDAVRSLIHCVLRHGDETPWYGEDHLSAITSREDVRDAAQTVVRMELLEERTVGGERQYRPRTDGVAYAYLNHLDYEYSENTRGCKVE